MQTIKKEKLRKSRTKPKQTTTTSPRETNRATLKILFLPHHHPPIYASTYRIHVQVVHLGHSREQADGPSPTKTNRHQKYYSSNITIPLYASTYRIQVVHLGHSKEQDERRIDQETNHRATPKILFLQHPPICINL